MQLTGFEIVLDEDASALLVPKELVESLVNVSEDVTIDRVIVRVTVSVVELLDVEPDAETVLVKLTGLVEISDEDCPLELSDSEVPLVLRVVLVRRVD